MKMYGILAFVGWAVAVSKATDPTALTVNPPIRHIGVENTLKKPIFIDVKTTGCFPQELLQKKINQFSRSSFKKELPVLDNPDIYFSGATSCEAVTIKALDSQGPQAMVFDGSYQLLPRQLRNQTLAVKEVLHIKSGKEERWCYIPEGTKKVLIKDKKGFSPLSFRKETFECRIEK
jgi:hypothetical protein